MKIKTEELRKTSGKYEEKCGNRFVIKNGKITHDQSKQPCNMPPASSEKYLAVRHHTM